MREHEPCPLGAVEVIRGAGTLARLRDPAVRAAMRATVEAKPERRRLRALIAAVDGDLGSIVVAFAGLRGWPALGLAVDANKFEQAVAATAAAFDRRRRLSQAYAWAEALGEALLLLVADEQERRHERELAFLARGVDPDDSAEARLLRSLAPEERLLAARVAAAPRGWAGSSEDYWRLQALQRRLRRRRAGVLACS